ncbi:uncharacterized protein SPAPADRAFT_63323 [Spathaspora passalidarum NRRL Y-27907]|uniref:Uncharacterized protein n=1 Tax=Spathaspora passalidarum (strain NRRL Y-27907 / 11-Y1) TaxID=619300 RepID=G3AUC7_SPAPN|nr:uncharacterized protein SPAPADRAFT_63323 [Spathaspora passalidarum NRRL Y-27907]EGW30503.1 hypothetical protein SPAPADRAFT_63323 [Spathaspora passalidarum NRRL Y-27907]
MDQVQKQLCDAKLKLNALHKQHTELVVETNKIKQQVTALKKNHRKFLRSLSKRTCNSRKKKKGKRKHSNSNLTNALIKVEPVDAATCCAAEVTTKPKDEMNLKMDISVKLENDGCNVTYDVGKLL